MGGRIEMNQKRREELWDQLRTDIEKTMDSKSAEYDGTYDVHKQFGDVSRELKISMVQAAGVHLNKHISAINTMCRGETGTQTMHERVVDAINFLRILDEMFIEWNDTKTEVNKDHGKEAARAGYQGGRFETRPV
jgi:hypothetical protein